MQIRRRKDSGSLRSLPTLVRPPPPPPPVCCAHILTLDVDFDPSKNARDERKARVAKNERQHQQNLSRAQGGSSSAAAVAPPPQAQRKKDIDRTLATTRASTASMGRFDKKLEGEKKLKGVKRKVRVHRYIYLSRILITVKKFDPTEVDASAEKSLNMAILSKLDRDPSAKKSVSDGVLNVRKAVRVASKGRGSAALARESAGKPDKRGKKGKR